MRRIEVDSPLALYRPEPGTQKAPAISHLEGQTLVLGHALGANRHMWDETLELLPENLDVILWEQPGHGNSGLLDIENPAVNDIADALADALEDIGIEEFHLAGLSLGGMTAIAFAEQYPERLKSVGVLNALPVLRPPDPWLDRATRVEEGGLAPLAQETMERWFTPSFLDAPQVASTREAFVETSVPGYAQCCRIIANTDLSGRVGEIAMPALLLTGEEDPGVTPDQMANLANQVVDPVDIVIVEGTSHMTAVQKPLAVAECLVYQLVA